jgi:hypothetical protein
VEPSLIILALYVLVMIARPDLGLPAPWDLHYADSEKVQPREAVDSEPLDRIANGLGDDVAGTPPSVR